MHERRHGGQERRKGETWGAGRANGVQVGGHEEGGVVGGRWGRRCWGQAVWGRGGLQWVAAVGRWMVMGASVGRVGAEGVGKARRGGERGGRGGGGRRHQ